MLPRAGYRGYYDGVAYSRGDYASYRSSSPRGGSNPKSAWGLIFDPGYVDPSHYSNRAYGQFLRCFKNSYVAPSSQSESTWQNSDVELTVSYDTESNQVIDGYSWDGTSYSSTA